MNERLLKLASSYRLAKAERLENSHSAGRVSEAVDADESLESAQQAMDIAGQPYEAASEIAVPTP